MEDYKALIIELYKLRKADATWRPNLSRPTPNTIKEECENVCRERWTPADAECLRRFFGPCNDLKSSLQAIQRRPTAKFKSILYFLKGDTKKPADKVVEIIAWLLDIRPRPYNVLVDYDRIRNEINRAGNQGLLQDLESSLKPPPQPNQPTVQGGKGGETMGASVDQPASAKQRNRLLIILRRFYGIPYFKSISIAVFAFAALATAGSWIYGWWDNKDLRKGLAGLQRCMYWAGDHYEQVSCNEQFGYDTMVVAFDSVRFHNMKRVTSPDTITLNAIGRLWYKKRNNKYEFYTSDGYYPPDPKYRVLPVTERIIMNEIRSRQASN
jgi:hypothetical protein